jgi:hypothetical protein
MASSRTRFAALLSVIALLWGCTGHQRLYGGPTLPPGLVAKGEIGVDALPGKTYELQSKRDGDIVTFSIAEAKEQK